MFAHPKQKLALRGTNFGVMLGATHPRLTASKRPQLGSIFAVVMGSVALVGVLAATAMNTLSGPVTSIARVTQKNQADAFMGLNASMLLTQGLDTDADGYKEPPVMVDAGTDPAPIGGGHLPSALGLALTDPWGTSYGYCAYDHGAAHSGADLISGDNTATAPTQPLVVVVAAGPDKEFQTTCAAYSSGEIDVSKTAGSDDLIFKYSYAMAAAATGGLWTLNASDENKAELKDNTGAVSVSVDRSGGVLEATAITSPLVSAPASASDTLSIGGGLLLDTASGTATTCGAGQTGALRLNAGLSALEICNGTTFSAFKALPVASGSDMQIYFNDSGVVAAASGLLWDKANTRLVVGGNLPAGGSPYQLQVIGDDAYASMTIDRYGNNTGAPKVVLRKGRGTAPVPAQIASGDTLGQISFIAYGASGFSSDGGGAEAAIAAQVSGTATDSLNMGTRLRFYTKADGATTNTNWMGINSDGKVYIGGFFTPRSALHVSGAIQPSDDTASCTAVKNGALRWSSSLLQVCTGTTWTTITTTESDPQVGSLTASKWCTANAGGTAIDCTQDAPSGGSLVDGDKGDITVSSSGAAWSVDAGAISFAKVQNIATNRLLGRSTAGSGSIEELTIGLGLSLSGGTLSASVASESDPQVGTLTTSKWCAANAGGTAIDCTQDAPTPASATTSASGIVQLADQTAMEAKSVGRVVTADVLGSHPFVPKVGVYFNGTGTLSVKTSFGVSSVTDLGIGYYRINFSTPFSSTNFMVQVTLGSTATRLAAVSRNVSYLDVQTYSVSGAGLQDEADVNVSIWGDQ